MCGIYASLGWDPDPRHLDTVSHRGPDGRGWRVFDSAAGAVALGHRRLSIIDLDERAAQPMSCDGERYWLTFNGEIYNFLELRGELQAHGISFVTASDSEVLLQAYVTWGEGMLDRLVGMFAFVIYDASEQRIFAARDRFGIKPFYYFSSPDGVAFGSEIKQLIDQPGFSRRMNVPRGYDFLSAGLTDHTDETMFADARQLRGGECVTLDLRRWKFGNELPVRRYYDIPRSSGPPMSEDEAADSFRRLFEQSVSLHLRSDVRVGSCLSGGLDSSSIVGVMDRMLKGGGTADPIHTVSACFAEKEVDEKPFIDAVVAAVHAEPHYVFPNPADAFALAEKVTWHQDEPFGSTSILAQWAVFQEAGHCGIKVMLDGQGADEQLAGYHDSFSCHAQALFRRGQWRDLARMFTERKDWHGLGIRTQLLSLMKSQAPMFLRKAARKMRKDAPTGDGWFDTSHFDAVKEPSGVLEEVLSRDRIGPLTSIGELCVLGIKATSLPSLLRYEDRNSMAHSVEARVPFLDHRLVEFNVKLWDQHKIVGGDTKRVLRRAMQGYLPERVRQRRDKLGFATPEQRWFRGALRPQVEAGVRQTLAVFPGLLDADRVTSLMNATLDGHRAFDFTLWRIISLGVWGKVFNVTV